MNPERWRQVRALLDRALSVEASERAALLDAACANDRELRVEVASLLVSHQQAGTTFLKKPAFDLKASEADWANQDGRAGRRVGVYRLQEQIGQGGGRGLPRGAGRRPVRPAGGD